MISKAEFDIIHTEVSRKAFKGISIWEKILNLLNEAAPLIFEGGALKWYQVGRAFKLAYILIKFIKTIKDEFSK